jgi:predicted PurR-regulated permease PerM
MNQWRKSKLMFWTVWLLLIAALIFVLQQIDFILNPVVAILTALFMPLLIAGFLYYLLNPLVRALEKIKLKRTLAVALVMLILLGTVIFTLLLGIPMIIDQTSALIAGIPDFINQLEVYALLLAEEPWMQQVDLEVILVNVETWLRNMGTGLLNNFVAGVGGALQMVTEIAFLIITVPVILFYMLHDGKKFPDFVEAISPERYKKNSRELLIQIDATIASYISGKGLASLIVGVMLFTLYSIIGLPSAFVLSIFAAITNFIPYVGPFIGAAPAVIVGLIESPTRAILAAVFVTIAQQLDGNFLTPLFVGKSLSIHPLTVILVLLASANIAGLVGMLIGVPLFAIIKTIVVYIAKWRKEQKVLEAEEKVRMSKEKTIIKE